ncbi:glycosyl hydrolase family 18 protein [Acidaminococcus intestini]|nr:glycosyl hydrolase family 18 protein [Acidaminococcus intestini]
MVFPDGTSRLKDTEQLASLLATGKSRKKHAVSILDLAEKHGFSGVEIDYETLWKKGDTRLQEHFLRFLSELETQAARRHLKVRVILEPSAPFGAPFPKNIEYVVMAYNLHGPHNGPGPKADLAFIRRTMKKMDALRGRPPLPFQWVAQSGRTEKKAVSFLNRRQRPLLNNMERFPSGMKPARPSIFPMKPMDTP